MEEVSDHHNAATKILRTKQTGDQSSKLCGSTSSNMVNGNATVVEDDEVTIVFAKVSAGETIISGVKKEGDQPNKSNSLLAVLDQETGLPKASEGNDTQCDNQELEIKENPIDAEESTCEPLILHLSDSDDEEASHSSPANTPIKPSATSKRIKKESNIIA